MVGITKVVTDFEKHEACEDFKRYAAVWERKGCPQEGKYYDDMVAAKDKFLSYYPPMPEL